MAESIKRRRTVKERKAISRLIRFFTEYATDSEASNIDQDQLNGVLDQIGFPYDAALTREARWIFTRKVEAGELFLQGQDPAEEVFKRVKLLDEKQRQRFLKMLMDAGWVETDDL